MRICPFTNKAPSSVNCSNCAFFVTETATRTTNCAIILAADRSSNAAHNLSALLERK